MKEIKNTPEMDQLTKKEKDLLEKDTQKEKQKKLKMVKTEASIISSLLDAKHKAQNRVFLYMNNDGIEELRDYIFGHNDTNPVQHIRDEYNNRVNILNTHLDELIEFEIKYQKKSKMR